MQGTNQAMKSKLQCLRYPIIFSLDGYRSPLHAAAFNDQVECLQLLLSRGGNVDTVDQSGRTPLIMAADNGHAGAVGKLAQVREQEQETVFGERIWLIYYLQLSVLSKLVCSLIDSAPPSFPFIIFIETL